MRQSFYNKLVATLEQDHSRDLSQDPLPFSSRYPSRLRAFAPSRVIVRGLWASYRAASHDRDCRTTMGSNVEPLSPTAHRQEPKTIETIVLQYVVRYARAG